MKSNKKQTIIFDMDGVLIDASNSFRVAAADTYKHYSGLELPLDEVSQLKKSGGHNNDWDMVEYLLGKINIFVNKKELVEYFENIYKVLSEKETPLVNDEFFEILSKDYNLAIFTGRTNHDTQRTLKKHNWNKFFYPIITMQEVGIDHQKPDNLGIELIKKELNSEKYYFLGDTVDDMKAAKMSEVEGLGILPPHDKSEELSKLLKLAGANVVFKSAMDIVDYVQK
ncbi:MAG: HAD-IA family hydrolase [bacterium]|nr:HAD-IA family hydrolase [bacterium]